jgi:hypothetical protein
VSYWRMGEWRAKGCKGDIIEDAEGLVLMNGEHGGTVEGGRESMESEGVLLRT